MEENRLYRLIYCKDKLPEKDGIYKTDFGDWGMMLSDWAENEDGLKPIWWLEEISMPSDEEIREFFEISESQSQDPYWIATQEGEITGAKWLRDKLFNNK